MQPAHLAAAQPPLHAAVERPAGAASQPRPLLALCGRGCTHALKLRESVKLGPQVQLELGADLAFPKASIVGTTAHRGAAAVAATSSSTASDATPSSSSSSNEVSSRDNTAPSDSSWDVSASFTSKDNPAPTLPAEPAPAASGLHSVHFAGPWVAVQWQADPEDRGKGVLRADAHHVSYSRSFRLGRKEDWWAVPLNASLSLTYSGQPYLSLSTSNWKLSLGAAAALLIAGKPVHLAHVEMGGLAVHFPLSFGGTLHNECLSERVEVDLTLKREGRGLRCDLHQLNGVLRLREE